MRSNISNVTVKFITAEPDFFDYHTYGVFKLREGCFMASAYDNIHSRLEGMNDPSYIEDELVSADIISHFIVRVGGVVIALLTIRFLLVFFSVSQNSILANLIYKISYLFAAPIFWLLNYHVITNSYSFEIATMIAIVVYAVIIWLATYILAILP